MTASSDRVIDATTRVIQNLIEAGKVQPTDLPEMVERIGTALSRVEAMATGAALTAPATPAPADTHASAPADSQAATKPATKPAAKTAAKIGAGAIAPRAGETPVRRGRPRQAPAVPIQKSVQDDYIVCLEDGKKMKMLKRHLKNAYGMTPEEYRAKWGLSDDYPMVAPNYRDLRRRMAQRGSAGGGFTGTAKVGGSAEKAAA